MSPGDKKRHSSSRRRVRQSIGLTALQLLKLRRLMTHAELSKLGLSGVKLRRMAQAGEIISIGNGIYASTAIDPFVAAVHATAKYYQRAVISDLTALQIHGLSNEFIKKIDVDVPRETSIRNKMLQVHRVPQNRLIGVMKLLYEGASIQVYDRERTLCEAYRLDPAGPIFYKALKRYVAEGKIDVAKIKKYDKAAKTHVLAHLRQELADA